MKLFVVSDIHSHYELLIEALNKAGFDPTNKDHWLISCGDCFDRGPESVEILHYLTQLERKILVKGNHDLLFDNLCTRSFPYSYDVSNGTVRTVQDFGGSTLPADFAKCCNIAWNKTAAYRDLLVNYFETKKYIFVHSWIPVYKRENPHPANKWIPLTTNEYREDWRNAGEVEWEDAMWGNPFLMAQAGLNKTGKTIVFGHFHTSWPRATYHGEEEFGENASFDIYHGDNYIAIDACTAYTKKVNVLVLEDGFL